MNKSRFSCTYEKIHAIYDYYNSFINCVHVLTTLNLLFSAPVYLETTFS